MSENKCESCEHKRRPDGGHCYMFREEPKSLCMQHQTRRSDTRSFLAQFEEASKRIKEWPQWMQDAAHETAATFPAPPMDGGKGGKQE